MLRDFKYSFLFLGKFLLVYFGANVLYGLYIDSYPNTPDPTTVWVTNQTSQVQNIFGEESSVEVQEGNRNVMMRSNGSGVIRVFEGCNGINVMIVFLAFMVAFGGSAKRLMWFVPAGLLVIHLFNILRIILLYEAAQRSSEYFYYIHKYVFTAALYLVVIALWIVWVSRLSSKPVRHVE